MENFINNGVVSIGNNNTNIINNDIDYQALLNELHILNEACDYNIHVLIEACEQKNYSKLSKELKFLGKKIIEVAKELGLTLLVKLLEKHL